MSSASAGFVTGSRFEAAALPADCRVVCTGLRAATARAEIERLACSRITALISFGFAGALDPALKVGDLVVADCVLAENGDRAQVNEALRRGLANDLPTAVIGPVCGIDTLAVTSVQKEILRHRTGAIAVDMESHIVADVATRQGLSFATVRAVSDIAETGLPPAAVGALTPDGSIALTRILGHLLRQPTSIPAVVGLSVNSNRARRTLRTAAAALRAAP